jgi:putative endonuclease
MLSHRHYYVYIMTNRSKTLYTGITSNLLKRVWQHKTGVFPGFSSRCRLDLLVYYQRFISVGDAIKPEKQIKTAPDYPGSEPFPASGTLNSSV